MTQNNIPKKSGQPEAPLLKDSEGEVTPADYLKAVKSRLKVGKQKVAFELLQQAAIQFPEDPFILSYYGCLLSVVERKYRTGIETCRKAIALLKKQATFGEEMLYPGFYLNLGRAYLAASKKDDAILAFKKGLQFDNGNGDLLKELRSLGVRKPPPVPFLDRTNPINKYIGKLLRAPKKKVSAP
jgi:tetratricopeptide (TPR) repeat protein